MTKSPEFPPGLPVGLEWEYNTLRAEILERIGQRQQILSITLTIAGVFLGVGLDTPGVALVYPPLAMFLAYAWTQNDLRVRTISGYIRDEIEEKVSGLHWEHHMQQKRGTSAENQWKMTVFAHGGAFLWTQAMALTIGVVQMGDSYLDESLSWPMALIDIVLIIADLWSMHKVYVLMQQAAATRKTQQEKQPSP